MVWSRGTLALPISLANILSNILRYFDYFFPTYGSLAFFVGDVKILSTVACGTARVASSQYFAFSSAIYAGAFADVNAICRLDWREMLLYEARAASCFCELVSGCTQIFPSIHR
jgi:hypothetical protein